MKIYLIPCENATYKVKVCNELPTYDAIQMIEEGAYPIDVWYREYNEDMSCNIRCTSPRNRDELICYLNRIGKRGVEIVRISTRDRWCAYDETLTPNEDAEVLFKARYDYLNNKHWQRKQKEWCWAV